MERKLVENNILIYLSLGFLSGTLEQMVALKTWIPVFISILDTHFLFFEFLLKSFKPA